jgi:hypothetical protein
MRANKPEPVKSSGKKLTIILVALALTGSVVFLRLRFKSTSPGEVDTKRPINPSVVFSGKETAANVSSKAFEQLGEFAADEAEKIMGTSAGVLIIRETSGPNSLRDMVRFFDMVQAESEACKSRLRAKGKVKMLPDHTLVRPAGAQRAVWGAGELVSLLQKHPPTTTVIAFCHLPEPLSEADKSWLRARPGKIIVVGALVPEIQPLVRAGVVHLAIAQRMPAPQLTAGIAESPAQRVLRVYQVLKPGIEQ